jgi:hypothetical protein
MPMAMSREEQDAFDRRMAGIMDPMLRPEGTAGGPVRSYSLDDIRRFLGMGGRPAMSTAEVADAAQMYERLPNPALPPTPPGGYDAPSPSIPYMPSTDPRGAAAPIPPPPRPAAPARPRLPVMAGMPSEADMQFQPARIDTFGGLSPADMAAMGQSAPAMPQPAPVAPAAAAAPVAPAAAAAPGRRAAVPVTRSPSPQDLARALAEQTERDRLIARGLGIRVP